MGKSMKQVIGKIVVSWKSSYYNVTIVEHRLDMDMMEMMEMMEMDINGMRKIIKSSK